MKVLIVDDEVIVAKALERAFRARGHEVFAVHSGIDALPVWDQNRPDVVLLDVMMPKMTGPQLLQEIKNKGKKVLLKATIVFMSAHSRVKSSATAQEMGGHAFIQKPFENVFELVEKVEGLIHP